jgi:hypothetical protein
MRRFAFGLALVVALVCLVGLSACSSAPNPAALKDKCFSNEALIGAEMKLFYADSGTYPPITTVVEKMHLACPSGGVYSYDATSGVVTCSVHGHP